jgi:hypothetical protein
VGVERIDGGLRSVITTGKQPEALAEFDPLRRSGRWHYRYPRL